VSLTRAQLIAGDSGQGPVLPGQVQGVKEGNGVSIANDGTISFDSTSAQGVVKTNNPSAFNNYVWPNAKVNDAFLLTSSSGDGLNWVSRGFGIGQDGTVAKSIKQSIPFGEFPSGVPEIGSDSDQATLGSVYWNTSSKQLFICTSTSDPGEWYPASYGPLDLNESLLSGTYTLYVNPEIGEDTYAVGIRESGVRQQEVVAGFTPQKPFRTIARAALEIARLQDGIGGDSQFFDRYVIKCSAGVHYIDNRTGASVSAWDDEFVPENDDLRKLNSSSNSGVILPRGVSVIGEDLRKTVIKPLFVPDKTGNIETARGSIFRITGGGFFFNFTFRDKEGYNESHHLLDCISFVSDADLEDYYDKTQIIFSQSFDNDSVEPGETEIVAPKPEGIPSSDTDGITGASPYIFNCSVRSLYGLCGINADGSQVTGFRSLVTAQFTGVSLQKDPYCWEKYNPVSNSWQALSGIFYDEYIQLDPNDVRMNPNRISFHIRAINGAFIQEVSIFAIGQGIHHWAKNGGELSITNSNSSFGGCAALAEGFKDKCFPQDDNWNIASIVVAENMADQLRFVNTIKVGTIDTGVLDNATTLTLSQSLTESGVYSGVPEILASKGYTFKEDSYLWVENPEGPDWRAPLSALAWDPSDPDQISIKVPMENQDGVSPGEEKTFALGTYWPSLEGKSVYIRRLVDNRTVDQRRYSVTVTNTDSNTRTPLRDYILQTSTGTGGGIVSEISLSNAIRVNKSGNIPIGDDPVVRKVSLVLERINPENTWAAGSYYRSGDTVKKDGKHYTCVVTNKDQTFEVSRWSESFVHMESNFNAYDYFQNVAPSVIFDDDTDSDEGTTTCGYNLTTAWTSRADVRDQNRTSTDYRGVKQFLIGMGFSAAEADTILTPKVKSSRKLDPSSSSDMGGYTPSGAAESLSNWPVEFRRPSVVRLFGHSWEWAGFLNYTKALPEYQGSLSAQNQFSYYFTNKLGGNVYATGFNQEGYFVTAAGLTDLSTGTTTSVSNIGNPFIGLDIPQYFEDLVVGNLTVNNLINFPANGSANASTSKYGLVKLATISDIDTIETIASSDEEIDESSDKLITLPGLNRWKDQNNLLIGAQEGATIVMLHVASGEPLTGADSVPYGYPTSGHTFVGPLSTGLRKVKFSTVTEALEEASKIFVPVGSEVVISVHDNLSEVEAGPLTIGNGITSWVLAGARGATNPKVKIKRGVTEFGSSRLPQVDAAVFTVGAIIADIEVEFDCDNLGTTNFLTLDGGFGVGGRDTIVRWKNIASGSELTNATCSYGGKLQTRIYSSVSEGDKEIRTILEKGTGSVSSPTFRMFGPSGGILGHGADIVYDFQTGEYGDGSNGTLVFKFQHDFSNPVPLEFYAIGGRGGCKTGTRLSPIIGWDFSGDDWDLGNFISPDFYENQNYNGVSFKTRPLLTTLSADYGINSSTAGTFSKITLTRGCSLDISTEIAKNAGAFGLLLAVEGEGPIPATLVEAENGLGSYVYGGDPARNIQPPLPPI